MVSPQEREFRKKLKELREHLVQNADYVGRKFPEEARFPYLGDAFQLQGKASGLQRVHVFNWGCTMSHGALGGDIPGIEIGANRWLKPSCGICSLRMRTSLRRCSRQTRMN
jgi:hypothetical protein